MRNVWPSRRFSYRLTATYAEDQLAMHAESKLAAQKALGFAATEGERTEATELAYVADTELTLQFKPGIHFVEPQDQMHHARRRFASC